jgi:hypothetical protein
MGMGGNRAHRIAQARCDAPSTKRCLEIFAQNQSGTALNWFLAVKGQTSEDFEKRTKPRWKRQVRKYCT